MLILFDLATPKAVRFFAPMMAGLEARGIRTAAVSRDYPEVQELVKALGIDAPCLGAHGGAELRAKTERSVERVAALLDPLERLAPDAVVSLTVPESTRAAYGLGIPAVCFSDIPEAVHTARLSLPLARRVLAPALIDPAVFAGCGVTGERLYRYRSLDPLAWLDRAFEEEPPPLGLDPERPIVVCRETEWQSSYVRHDVVRELLPTLREAHPDWQIVPVPRYDEHPYVDVPRLLAAADLLLGGGGTMCIEAAFFGVPVLASRGRRVAYMDWLFERDLAIECTEPAALLARAEQLVAERGGPEAAARRARARACFDPLAFPLEAVLDVLVDAARGEPAREAPAAPPDADGVDPSARLQPGCRVDEGATVGPGTRVWAGAQVLAGARVGAGCNLSAGSFVEGRVVVGDRVTVKGGVHLYDGVVVEDDVFVGAGAAFTNDRRPRSGIPMKSLPRIVLGRGCSVGANATLLPGVAVGPFALVGAGAVVTRDVPAHALVYGNPARREGWLCRCAAPLELRDERAECGACGRRYRKVGDGLAETRREGSGS